MQPRVVPNIDRSSPGRCYACFRPQADCFCAIIPKIQNRVEVLILQHQRERSHPFNTARIVQQSLQNASLLVGHSHQLATRLPLKPGAGLLYPGPDATLLTDLPADQHPTQLVVLDGTWHHAKTFLRDIPALQSLPRYQLAPTVPSSYRIRREPTVTSLSTVEAIVAALQTLEPTTGGFTELLNAFNVMVERQLAHPKVVHRCRNTARRNRNLKNIPSALWEDLEHLVVAYGESPGGKRGDKCLPLSPVYWVAQRLGTGERFACAIQPEFPLSDYFLHHLQLTQQDFAEALSPQEARTAWHAFQRPRDILAVYNPGTAKLLSHLTGSGTPCLVLKSVDLYTQPRYQTLDELLAAEGVSLPSANHSNRASQRLANVVAFVRHLIAMGQTAVKAGENPAE